MAGITLSNDQVFKYLTATFYRPSVYESQFEAEIIRTALAQCRENGLFKPFIYYHESKNRPTIRNTLDYHKTPQGVIFWDKVHQRIMDTVGYNKVVANFLTPSQLQKLDLVVKPWVQKKYPPKRTEDPNETREII